MSNWKPCGYGIAIGDVVRWTEPVLVKTAKNEPLVEAGTRRVTAKVLAIPLMGAELRVINCVILSTVGAGSPLLRLKRGMVIKRKPRILYNCQAERLPWGGKHGESERALAISLFLMRNRE
jgi:hypothetical protein